MRCIKQGGGTFPCRQCLPCRINRRRQVTARLFYEASLHECNSFLTLTYDDAHLPPDFSLVPEHTKLFLKRFRDRYGYNAFRYYLVGEYGDTTSRPHYHAILFGVGATEDNRRMLYDSWKKCSYHRCTLDPFTLERAEYVAGYVTKKMTKKDDPRLQGRYPEYARMSLKPGLGAVAMNTVAEKFLSNYFVCESIAEEGVVPGFLKSNGRTLPFDRYLRGKLENAVGFDQSITSKLRRSTVQEQKFVSEMSLVYSDPEALTAFLRTKGFEPSLETREQKARNLEARYKINSKGRKL